jgi:hypothetical protein
MLVKNGTEKEVHVLPANIRKAWRIVAPNLPPNASMAQILHALYIAVSFERGLDDIRKGRTITHKEAKKRHQEWLR